MNGLTKLIGFGAVALMASSVASAQSVRGVSKSEVLIGMHTDLSGPAAFYGVSSRNGMQMRIDEVNATGGVHGRKLKLIVEDNQYSVPRAVQAANKLLNRDRVFLMAGALGTPMNNAVFKDQFEARVPNLFPLTAARSMAEPLHPLKFALQSTYYDHIRVGVKYLVETQGKKNVCAMYQDTDFGQEIFEGVRDQLAAMNMKLVETTTHKPTDTDFTAPISKLRSANCDLVAMGTIIRDTIIPYGTARKMGWTSVDFTGQAASWDYPIAAVAGGATEGFYSAGGTVIPYRDTASPEVQAWMDRYKAKFNADINIGSIYGQVLMDMIVLALDRAGPGLTTDGFVKALEGVQGYRDMFGGPVSGFSATNHKGSNASFLYQVKGGRWVKLTDSLTY